MPYSILIFLSLSSFILTAKAQSSFELTCRNQAKEIASETYKNCVTTQRQGQVEEIRKEYQQKLSDLKSHYDGELKKVSSGQNHASSPKLTVASEIRKDKSGIMKRASGARELPEKKISSNSVKTETIDFSRQSNNAAPAASDDSTEIVEIPVD